MKKILPADAVLIPNTAVRVFQGAIYDTYQWAQKLFDGSDATFEMLRRPDTVEAICVVDNKVLVLKDEQPHRGSRLSFPGGRVDEDDEDITIAAKREILEETGYEFNQWRLIRVWQPLTKIEWFIHQFIAWDVTTKSDPHFDAGEKITVEHLPFKEVKRLVLGKAGYLGEAQAVFEDKSGVEELLVLPNFEGKAVEREDKV